MSKIQTDSKFREKIFPLIAIFFTCIIVASLWISKKDYSRFNADNYVTYSYNFTINKMFSGSIGLVDKKPDLRRAPAYPLFLSLVFLITDQKKKLQDCFENGLQTKCDELYFLMQVSQSLLLILFGFFTYLCCSCLNNNVILNVIITTISVLVVSKEIVFNCHSEALSIPFAAILTYFLLSWTQKKSFSFLFALLSGLVISFLILTRPAYLYYPPFFLCLTLLLTFIKRKGLYIEIKQLLAFILSICIGLSPWIIRNKLNFNTFEIANSGSAKVLSVREEHNKMSNREFFSGFIYWVPIPLANKYIQKNLDGESFKRFDVSYENSFRRIGEKNSVILVEKYGHEKASKRLLSDILKKPIHNLKMSVLFLWRGIHYVALFFPFFLYVMIKSFSDREKHHFLLIFSLALFTLLFHSLITHFNVRYGYPLIASFAPCVSLSFKLWKEKNG